MALDFDDWDARLVRELHHLGLGGGINTDINLAGGNAMAIKPFSGIHAPTAHRAAEQADILYFHAAANLAQVSPDGNPGGDYGSVMKVSLCS